MRSIHAIIIGALFFMSTSAVALVWTGESVVSFVRTYNGVDFSIGLKDFECPNEKNYYFVTNRADNASFSAIALTSLTTGKKVNISYESTIDAVHCYVNGIWIVN